jgi:hypothetical protein
MRVPVHGEQAGVVTLTDKFFTYPRNRIGRTAGLYGESWQNVHTPQAQVVSDTTAVTSARMRRARSAGEWSVSTQRAFSVTRI